MHQFTPKRVVRELKRLLTENSFREAAAKCAWLIAKEQDKNVLMQWIEDRISVIMK